MGAPSSSAVYQAEKSPKRRTPSARYGTLSPHGRRVVLPAPSIVPARLVRTATIAPFTTAARPAATTALATTDATPGAATTRVTEVTAAPVAATPAPAVCYDLLCLGRPRPEDAQRGGQECGAADLHRPAACDRAGVQTDSQIVEGAGHPSFSTLRQQRSVSFPSCTPQPFDVRQGMITTSMQQRNYEHLTACI